MLASDDAAIELSPCCASVSRSAVGSNWVSSPLAHRFWKANCDVLGLQIRDWNEVSVVMGRDLVENELAEEEKTRKAAFRRQSLCQLLAEFAQAAISDTYMTVKSKGVWIREAHYTLYSLCRRSDGNFHLEKFPDKLA